VRRPVAVAVTGGIGVGKTETLRAFERHGAAVVSSDEIVHRLLREHDDVKRTVVERFGPGVLAGDGEIDRERVADVVFTDRTQLAWLEGLLHPLVAGEYLRWRDELAQLADPPALAVTEVPLLYEVGADERFDVVVALTASPDVRMSRALRDLHGREQRLLPDADKLERADFAYVNDGTLEELDAFVRRVVDELTA